MLNFEIREIIDRASNLAVYKRGLEYYKTNKVYDIEIDRESEMISASVRGSGIYDVEIYLDEDHIVDANCECESFSTWRGFCKHIVATLLCVKMNNNSDYFNDHRKAFPINKIIDYYVDKDFEESPDKQEVKVAYSLTLDTYNQQVTLAVKLGENQLYVLKNPEEFFNNVEEMKEYTFGKKFSFDPKYHSFNEIDKKVIQIIKDVVEDEKYFNSTYFGNNKYTFIKGKEVLLTNKNLASLLQILDGEEIEIKMNENIGNVEITCSDIHVPFEITEKNSSFELKLNALDEVKPLTSDYRVLLKGSNMHYISEDQKNDLMPLFKTIESDSLSIVIEKGSLDMFMSYLYPTLKKSCEVNISTDVEDKLYLKDCDAKLYLEIDGDGIQANLKYNYGSYVYDAFNGLESEKPDSVIVLRDMKLENRIMQILEGSDLRVSKTGYHIDDEDEVYQFVRSGLPKLKNLVSVYYSDDFSQIKIKDKSSISISSSLDESMNYFNFKFSVDDIDHSEIPHILTALKEKKRYFRLNDGSFLTLDSVELNQFSTIMDDLSINGKDFNDGEVLIPNNRAFYLNDAIEKMTLEHFKRNLLFKELILRINAPEDESYVLPIEVKDILRPYQVTGYNWLKTLARYNFGGILADDMGLGKTLQVLAYIKSELEEDASKKSLIVAPTSLVYNWQNEVSKFLPSLKVLVIDGSKKVREDKLKTIDDYNIVITSYALVRNDIEIYNQLDVDLMIIDEAQHIKNPGSKTSRAIKTVKAKKRFALTGTPIENTILELWSIFDFVMPGYLQTLGRFKTTYEKPIKDGDEESLAALKKLITPFLLRRLKIDVLKELPDKIENKIVVDLHDDQKKVYMAYLDKVKDELETAYKSQGFNKSRIKILAALTRLRQICCDPSIFLENYEGSSSKLELLEELLEELIEGGHRVLIFSQFTTMLGNIKVLLEKMNINYFSLDGSTKAIKRNEMVNDFNDGENEVFLISLKAGGTGLNLTGADTVIHFDPWWNPAVEEQATDRAYRIGQTKKVHVIKIVTRGTIEEKIYALQEKKREIIKRVIQPGETLITQMTESDIRDLFE